MSGGVIDKVFQVFAGLEIGNFLSRHSDFFSGLAIAPHASAALARSEAAEAANLDLFALLQSADDALEYGLYNCFGLFARELRHVQNFLDQVGLGECRCALLGHLAMPRRAVPQRTAYAIPPASPAWSGVPRRGLLG